MDEMYRDLTQSASRTGSRAQNTSANERRVSDGPLYMHKDLSRARGETRSQNSRANSRAASGSTRSTNRDRDYNSYRRTDSRSSSSSSAAARRRRKKQKQQRAIVIGFFFLLLLFAITILVVVRSCTVGDGPQQPVAVDPANTVYAEGVYINGISVTGMSLAQAREALMPGIEQTVQRIAIALTGEMGGQTFHQSISASDMNISSDIEQVLLDALAGGKGKTYSSTLAIDYESLDRRIAEINNTLAFGPQDATFTIEPRDNGKPKLNFVEGHSGMGLDIAATEQLVREALEGGNYQAILTPPLTEQAPNITVEQLKTQVTLIGEYTTEYRHKGTSANTEAEYQTLVNRAFNVNKAAEKINGQVIQPGATWSYNKIVGDRNEKNGWKEANAIVGAETYRLEYGGGVCQVSSTLYNALLQANIEIVYRRKHSIPADYVSYGLDATVDTGHIDFKFKNDTEYPLYLFAYTKSISSRKSEVTVLLYGHSLPEGVEYVPRTVMAEETPPGEPIITYDDKQPIGYEMITVEARNGYKVEVYLDKKVNGEVVESTYLYTDEYEPIRQKITMGSMDMTIPDMIVTPEDYSELP